MDKDDLFIEPTMITVIDAQVEYAVCLILSFYFSFYPSFDSVQTQYVSSSSLLVFVLTILLPFLPSLFIFNPLQPPFFMISINTSSLIPSFTAYLITPHYFLIICSIPYCSNSSLYHFSSCFLFFYTMFLIIIVLNDSFSFDFNH